MQTNASWKSNSLLKESGRRRKLGYDSIAVSRLTHYLAKAFIFSPVRLDVAVSSSSYSGCEDSS